MQFYYRFDFLRITNLLNFYAFLDSLDKIIKIFIDSECNLIIQIFYLKSFLSFNARIPSKLKDIFIFCHLNIFLVHIDLENCH